MKEWRMLERYNLPPDILKGHAKYEFRVFIESRWKESSTPIQTILKQLPDGILGYQYRERVYEHTHTDRMTKFWKTDGGAWIRMHGYVSGNYLFYSPDLTNRVIMENHFSPKWFDSRESADIPPEVE